MSDVANAASRPENRYDSPVNVREADRRNGGRSFG